MGNQTDILPTTYPSFPWSQGDLLDAVPLNNAFIAQQNQIDSINNRMTDPSAGVAFSMTVNWGGNTSPTEGPYMLMAEAPYQFTILNVDFSVGTNAGSLIATFLNNNAAIGGLENISVTAFQRNTAVAVSNNVIDAGNSLSMNITNVVGIPQNSWFCIVGNTQPIPQEIGVGLGAAVGLSNAVGVLVNVIDGSVLASTIGNAVVAGFGMAGARGAGTAFGNSTANMTGVHVTIGNFVGIASGTSTAAANGVTQVDAQHVLVLNDPNVGILNTNPLG